MDKESGRVPSKGIRGTRPRNSTKVNNQQDQPYGGGGGGGGMQEDKRDTLVKEVECVVFVPYTPRSKLKNALQSQDDILCQTLKVPGVWFIERGGDKIVETVGQANPWRS